MITRGKLLLKLSSIYYQTSTRMLSALETKSESIESGLGEFASIASRMKIKYFYEVLETPLMGGGSAMVG